MKCVITIEREGTEIKNIQCSCVHWCMKTTTSIVITTIKLPEELTRASGILLLVEKYTCEPPLSLKSRKNKQKHKHTKKTPNNQTPPPQSNKKTNKKPPNL